MMKMDLRPQFVLNTLLLLIVAPLATCGFCPRRCSCPQPTELHCTFRSLLTIPAAVPKHVKHMNLGFNRINNITDRSLLGLRKLEMLMLHGNDFHRLPDGAFTELASLQMLKMSYNKLTEISRLALHGLWSVARLHLDHNQLQFIHPDAFQGLTSLWLLQLEGNQLQQLHPDTFTTFTVKSYFHVSTLRHLYLSDNHLATLPSRLVTSMPQLESLYLHRNPWICDCSLRWLHDWNKKFPGVVKCKKDRTLPAGQLCPTCSSPRRLQRKELFDAENLVCRSPVITSPHRMSTPQDVESEVLTTEDFIEPFGNLSLGLSDEHGTELDLMCNVSKSNELTKISWQHQLTNITVAVDLDCPVNREKYEKLWRLIAYYSNVPAHLQSVLSKDLHQTRVYRQDSEKDALYYTGLNVNITARPSWLLQTSVNLQLNRLQSSATMAKLILSTELSETVQAEEVQLQKRSWVMIESTNSSRKVSSAILGQQTRLNCDVHGSAQPVIRWTLPDGSKVEAPYSGNRLSVTRGGALMIKAVRHTDAGTYYCIATAHGDFAVSPFYLTVQESSSPRDEASIKASEVFVGRPVSLHCTASASPDAEINWILPNSNIVSLQTNSSRALVFSNGTLHIPQSNLLDSGYYKCVAVNQHGVDTLATKLVVIRHNFRKFPAAPQSASGVNTRIKIPTEDAEASGDAEGSQGGAPVNHLEPLRRRLPGGVVPSRRGVHPSRYFWRKPPVLQKPGGSRVVDRKNPAENTRRINISKGQIDPQKWAHILAKIRDRKAQNTVTPNPTRLTTEREAAAWTTQSNEAAEGSSDSVTELAPLHNPLLQTDKPNAQDQPVTSNSNTIDDAHGKQATTAHTPNDVVLDRHTSSNSVFPPQTTSGPAVTSCQSLTNTDVNEHKTADWSKESQRRVDAERLKVTASSSNDNEPFLKRILSVNPNNSTKSKEEKYPSVIKSDDLQSGAVASPTTVQGAESPPRLQQHNSRRRNGSQRRRPNRRKQKLVKSAPSTAVTPAKAIPATVKTTLLKIASSEVTATNPSTTAPFSVSQEASSGKLSHKESTASRRDHEAATEPSSPPAPLLQTKDLPLLKSTLAPPSLPATFPDVGDTKTTSQTERPLEHFSAPTPTTSQRLINTPAAPIRLPEETQRSSSDSLLVGFYATNTKPLQTSGEESQLGQQHTTNEGLSESGAGLLAPSSSTDTSSIDRVIEATSGYTPSDLTVTPSILPQDYLQTALDVSAAPETSHSSPNKPSKVAPNPKGALNENVFPSTASLYLTSAATPRLDPVTRIKVTVATTLPEISVTEAQMDSSPMTSKQETPWITVGHNGDQQIKPIINQSEPRKESNFPPTTQSADHKPTSARLVTSAPTAATVQTNPYTLLTTHNVSRKQQEPRPGSVPRGKPTIAKTHSQTFTVKAETDAQLPCETEGDPKPFLSWTKALTGANIPQNTRVHRFEVHQNGTLIIRNTQLADGGRYLCTVQNQYGTDSMPVNLVVLPQPPRVLHPQHREMTVHLGDKVDLECKVEGHPAPRVTWVLPNYVHVAAGSGPSQQHVVVGDNGILRISRARHTDRGIYKCIGSSAAGTDSVSVRLHVRASPPVIQQSHHETATVSEGSPAYIHCTATGSPPPVIRWSTPDGAQLTASLDTGQNLIVFPNGTLYIQRVGKGDTGRYQCSASNTVASSRRTVILNIRKNLSSAKASITLSSPQRTDVMYGRSLLLNCVAAGQPEPRIIWRTPSKKLVDAQYSFDRRIKVFPNGSISLHPVTDEDGGDYLCVARNKMGDDHVLLRVHVLSRPAKIEQKQQRSSQEVLYGGDLTVDCVASGLPNPEISWVLPDGTMVNPVKRSDGVFEGRGRRFVVFDNGTLYFNNVRLPEEGDYTCYAENQHSKDEMKVRVKVKAAPSPPKIQHKDPQTVSVVYGKDATLRCNAKGEPAPVVTWLSPLNKVIPPASDKYQLLDDGTLVVQKIQGFDKGNYTCIARNNAGQDHEVTRLQVLVTPPVISGLRGTLNAIKVTAVQNQQTLLDCSVHGNPAPRITWLLPGNVTLSAPHYSSRMVVHQNGTLEIHSPQETDSGQLVCIARNEGGEVRVVVNLDVRPQTRARKANVESLSLGNAVALNCSSEGSTLPVTWILPSGTPLRSGARFSKFSHQPDGLLVISNPSVAEAGVYRCLIHNSGGLVEHAVTLSPGRKPEISSRYNSPIGVMNGQNLWLHCQTTGEALRLAWTLPSGVVLSRPQRAGRYAVQPNGTLAIQQASVHDRGPYVCRASNEYGSSSLSILVNVIAYPPQITNGPPSVTYAKRGVAVQLNCVATGVPKVEVAWETPDKIRLAADAKPQLFENKYLLPQGSLIIQNPTQRDAGIYRCTATNAIGLDSKATVLNVF